MNVKWLLAGLLLVIIAGISYTARQHSTGSFIASSADIPLPNTADRPRLLRFGMYVTPNPAQNPIDPPERFTGFHTALDLEITEQERDTKVPVHAICDGPILQNSLVEGYGGLAIQKCTIQEQSVTVLYGHLTQSSIPSVDTQIKRGQRIGSLASTNSEDSGHTRKHLHLGIHKGENIVVKGYVLDEKELEQFIDPEIILHFE